MPPVTESIVLSRIFFSLSAFASAANSAGLLTTSAAWISSHRRNSNIIVIV